MHERRRTERGLGDRSAIDEAGDAAAQRHVDPRRQLHEQIVRMLAVDQRVTPFAVSPVANRLG